MQAESKKTPSGSLRFFQSQNTVQKIPFTEYDEQPTMIFLSSNRQSFQSKKSRPYENNQSLKKFNAKLRTYESNLMQSSPQRSQNSVTDGQFVCNYLTPIKKQQFHKLLFKDQINESPKRKTKSKGQIHQNLKQTKNHQLFRNKSKYNENFKTSQMIDSFLPSQILSNLQSAKNQFQYSQKACNCQSIQQIKNQHSGIFIDPCSKINFLKLNNQDLFSKLQKQILKNTQLQSQIITLKHQNERLLSENIQNTQKISKLKKLIKTYDDERKKFLAKQMEQFKFVKEILVQKKRSKSKGLQKKTQSFKTTEKTLSQQKVLRQTLKQQSFINLPKRQTQNQNGLDSKQTSYINFTSRNRGQNDKAYTIFTQFDTQPQFFKKGRKLQFQKKNTKKRSEKQNENLERFLKEKLQVNCSNQKNKKNQKFLESHLNPNKQNLLTQFRKRSKTMNSKKS